MVNLGLLRYVLPKVPMLLTESGKHYAGLNPASKEWDVRTLITIKLLQAFIYGDEVGKNDGKEKGGKKKEKMTVERMQKLSVTPQEVTEDMWVVKYGFKLNGAHAEGVDVEGECVGLEGLVDKAIWEIGGGEEGMKGVEVGKADLWRRGGEGEWVGWRDQKKWGRYQDKEAKGLAEGMGENLKERYGNMVGDVRGLQEKMGKGKGGVVMWIHGGGYFILDPASHRNIARDLSKATGCPIFLPRYRLAPQHPFPAGLVDCLISYLHLLYPSPDALHPAFPPHEIFIGGDSAGGGMTMALAQLLLWFNTPSPTTGSNPTITWGGASRSVPLPAGLFCMSGYFDVTRSFQAPLPSGRGGSSETTCASGDYLPPPDIAIRQTYAPSSSWPSKSCPRTHMYAPNSAMTHPLVSPIAAPPQAWVGCPPVWLHMGDECLRDSNYYLTHTLLSTTPPVPLSATHYTNMPHVWQAVIAHVPAARHSVENLASFIHEYLQRPYDRQMTAVKQETARIRSRDLKVIEGGIPREELSLNGMEHREVVEQMLKEVAGWKVYGAQEGPVEEGDVKGVQATAELAGSKVGTGSKL